MDTAQATAAPRSPNAILTISTIGFTLLFAVWLMFGVLGIAIRKEFNLSDLQLSGLSAAAILTGAIFRLPFGILADRVGGRVVMTGLLAFAAIPAFLVSQANSYPMLLVLALFVGIAGNSFSVGVSWNSSWFPQSKQGLALGVFGAGNVGASVTKLIGPALIALVPASALIPGGWRFVPFLYAILLLVMAAITWFASPTPDRTPGAQRSLREMLRPLKHVRVWRFGMYYVIVFGAYVALSSWLPKYYVDVFGLELHTAALLTALFIFPASLLRPLGGFLSDRYGARGLMYLTFVIMFAATFALGLIPSLSLGVVGFTALVVVVGVAMGVGKSAVFKYIPEYFPQDVGAVGGLVGMLGALGGFFLPPVFALVSTWTGAPHTMFLVLAILSVLSLTWLHTTVTVLRRAESRTSLPSVLN
jgi:MFS transporter, NNP family, nitrate/nitrite transporter